MESTSSSQMIKPCRVQITDIRRMKNQDGQIVTDALNESNEQPSGSSSSNKHSSQQGACTVLIVPNEESSESTSVDAEPSEGTMLMVSEDGWIKGEPKSPDGLGQTVDGSKEGQSYDVSDDDSDFDMDEIAADDEWMPDPGSDSDDSIGNEIEEEEEEENSDAGSVDYSSIDFKQPLTPDVLKKIMQVVYSVPQPNVSTLLLLKEQMEERPKLKIKLLKDLRRGHSIFKKKKQRSSTVVTKKQIVETPSQPKSDSPKAPPTVQWSPRQPLTLAQATAHLAAQKSSGTQIQSSNMPPLFPSKGSHSYRSIAPKPPGYVPQTNGIFNPNLASTSRSAGATRSPATSGSSKPSTNMTFLDHSKPSTRAVFMPEKRTVKIPELKPGPAGSVDVLVPVDANGQMKEPFMGIPMDSCKLVFGSDSDEPNSKSNAQRDTPGRSFNDEQTNQPSSLPQPGTPPSAGVFPQPKTAFTRPRAPFPPGVLPPGMVPVGLAPAGARPPGVFPPHMFPPGSIPPGMVPVPLPPDAMRFPVPGPHIPCTCPPGVRPPGPPVHSLLHLQKDDMSKFPGEESNSSALEEQSSQPPVAGKGSSPTTSNDNRSDSPGIKIASVRSCTSHVPGSSKTPQTAAPAGPGNHPGSLLTVILPSSAREHYKQKLDLKSNPFTSNVNEIHNAATKVDLGIVWNEISLLRTEIQSIKSKVASDIHNIRTDMEEFVKLVGARLGIAPATPTNQTTQGDDRGTKRTIESDAEEDIASKRSRVASE